jgi:DNA invertase Pin-like site-specific DNA recombinase
MRRATAVVVPVRCGIYCRISHDDQGDELGVKRQEKACRALVAREGWSLVDVYVDNDRSASKVEVDRPEYRRMLGDLTAGRINRLVALSTDRLTRKSAAEIEPLIALHRTLDLDEIATVTDGAIRVQTAAGRLLTRVRGDFDAFYAESLSEKVKLKKNELAERGLPPGGGRRPYGFNAANRRTGLRGGIRVVPSEAKMIREAARRVLRGEQLSTIVNDWNDRGIPTAMGKDRWRWGRLRTILLSPRVAGLREHRGQIVGNALWKPILDRDTWERVRVALTAGPPRAPHTKALLTGLLVCGRDDHGRTLIRSRSNGLPSYVCPSPPDGCGRLAIKAVPVEEIVTETVFTLFDGGQLETVLTQKSKTRKPNPAAEVAKIEAELDRLADLLGSGKLTAAQFTRANSGLMQRLEEAEKKVAEVRESENTTALLTPYKAKPGLLRQQWPKLNVDQRRAVLAAVIDRIEIKPGEIGCRFDPSRIDITWAA